MSSSHAFGYSEGSRAGEIPPGRYYREYVWQAINDPTVPSWLTATGTVTIDSVANNAGKIKVSTTNFINNYAGLALAHDIRYEYFAAVDLIVHGWSFDTDDTTKIEPALTIEDWTSNEGGRFYQPTTGGRVVGLIHNAGGDVTKTMRERWVGDNHGDKAKSIMVRAYPRDGGVALFRDGELVDTFFDKSKWVVAGTVKPSFGITTREAVAHSMSFGLVAVRMWS